MQLLRQLAPRLSADEAAQIVEALGDLPLALHLSGCYLARYRISAADYLARLASMQLKHQALQNKGVEHLLTEGSPHVERAFALSVSPLDANKPVDERARQLLARASCFAPGEPLWREWLEMTISPEGDKQERQRARADAIERLLSLGLLESLGEAEVRLHRLLAAYTTLVLNDAEALPAVERVVNQVVHLANESRSSEALLAVLPHLRHLVQGSEGREDDGAAMLCTNLGFSLMSGGAHRDRRARGAAQGQ